MAVRGASASLTPEEWNIELYQYLGSHDISDIPDAQGDTRILLDFFGDTRTLLGCIKIFTVHWK